MTGESHWGRSFFGSLHFFTGFPVKRIGSVTGQSIEVSSDYASCLCLMRKVSALPREWDTRPVSHWDVQYTLLKNTVQYKNILLFHLRCGKWNVLFKEEYCWWKWTWLDILSTKYLPSLYVFLFCCKIVYNATCFMSKGLHISLKENAIYVLHPLQSKAGNQFSVKGAGPQDIINNVDIKEKYTVCFAFLGPFAFFWHIFLLQTSSQA